tara:strand:+ start:4950 stop:5369 length:420 start_codon:yes stop_codon:yes gene_type:complete
MTYSTEHIVDKKGFIFKIKDLSKKKTEKLLRYYKNKMKTDVWNLKQLWTHLYEFDEEQSPKETKISILGIDKKIANQAGITLNAEMRTKFGDLEKYNEQFEFAQRQQQVINLTIMQLEAGADINLILNILKQASLEEDK